MGWSRFSGAFALIALAFFAACGDEEERASSSTPDVRIAPIEDAGAALDGGRVDDSGFSFDGGMLDGGFDDAGIFGDAGTQNLPEERAAPVEAWTPPSSWLVTSVPLGSSNDPLAEAFSARRFSAPTGPGRVDGIEWGEQIPDEDGNFFFFGRAVLYGVMRVRTTEPLRLLARLDRFELLVDNRIIHTPDPYRTGRVRHAIYLAPGEHELVIRGSNERGSPKVWFERATAPVHLNVNDITRPDLIPGERRPAPLGVHLLNLSGSPLEGLRAVVVEHPLFVSTVREQPDVPRDALTPVVFDLTPRGPLPSDVHTATITLGIEARGFDRLYTFELSVPLFSGGRAIRRTFVSGIDGSAQYYAVNGPERSPATPAALVLSLHGAGVQAAGQARAYGTKDWAYIVAPTNRRPFGFDWQDWGRLDALEVLAEAQATLNVDPTQVYVTGHSMGGHGTWHVGILHPDRFAVLGPSAGWISFSTYGGAPSLPPSWEPARLHDDTLAYKDNLARRGVFMIHGTNDTNVPVAQSRTMYRELTGVTPDLFLHEEPGAGHWWDGDPAPGARCVDFPGLFELFQRSRRALELEFGFRSPAPWVSPRFGFLTVEAVEDPYRAFEVRSERQQNNRLVVTTTNAQALVLDGSTLSDEGLERVSVDGEERLVRPGPMRFGQAEKRPGRHGPIKEVFFRPFCFIVPDNDLRAEGWAAHLTSTWSVIGNGAACTLPWSRRSEAGDRNRIYLNVPSTSIDLPSGIPFAWDDQGVRINGTSTGVPTFFGVTFPEGDHLSVSLFAVGRAESLVPFFAPFSSRSAYPDWFSFVLTPDGRPAYGPSGWFDANWRYDPTLSR